MAFEPEQMNHDFHCLIALRRLKPDVTIALANARGNDAAGHIAEVIRNRTRAVKRESGR